jgi:hypothetical protein
VACGPKAQSVTSVVVQAEEAAHVEVTVGGELDVLEPDAELCRPEPVRERLARQQRAERCLDGVGRAGRASPRGWSRRPSPARASDR